MQTRHFQPSELPWESSLFESLLCLGDSLPGSDAGNPIICKQKSWTSAPGAPAIPDQSVNPDTATLSSSLALNIEAAVLIKHLASTQVMFPAAQYSVKSEKGFWATRLSNHALSPFLCHL